MFVSGVRLCELVSHSRPTIHTSFCGHGSVNIATRDWTGYNAAAAPKPSVHAMRRVKVRYTSENDSTPVVVQGSRLANILRFPASTCTAAERTGFIVIFILIV